MKVIEYWPLYDMWICYITSTKDCSTIAITNRFKPYPLIKVLYGVSHPDVWEDQL